MSTEEQKHLHSGCLYCEPICKVLRDNPWRFEAWLCEAYDKIYQSNEEAYRKLNKS